MPTVITGETGVNKVTSADVVPYTPAGTGAVPTDVQSKLREFVSVKDFGAVGDGVTDDTAAIQAALTYSYLNAPQVSWRYLTIKVRFPAGIYRVAQPNELFKGLAAGSFRIEGEGRGKTQIFYDAPSATSSDYLINNDGLFGFTSFVGIQFYANPAIPNQNFFNYVGGGPGNAQSIEFHDCGFAGFTDIFNVSGGSMTSETTFMNCKFNGFTGVAFRFNNNQGVNYRFFACDIESFPGTVFEYLAGQTVLFIQGSIITNSSTSRVVKVPSTANPNLFGATNTPNVVFIGTRFEMHAGALMTEKVQVNTNLSIVYENCGMGGYNIPSVGGHKMFTWAGEGKIVMRGCFNLEKYLFDYTTPGSINEVLTVIMDNCDAPTNLISGSSFVLSNGASNTARYPLFSITNCSRQLNGVYRAKGKSSAGRESKNNFVTFTNEDERIAICYHDMTYDYYLPPVFITKIKAFPKANPGNGSVVGTLTITNAAGTVTLATLSWTLGSPASNVIEVDCLYRVDVENGDYLKFNFQNSNGGPTYITTFAGHLILEY